MLHAAKAIAVAAILTSTARGGEHPLAMARTAFDGGNHQLAMQVVDAYIAEKPADANGYRRRAEFFIHLRERAKAVADLSRVIELDPNDAEALDLRGSEYFKLGKMTESAADFDKFLAKRPRAKPEHWRRGITLYYAGRYKDGAEQFEAHQTVNPNDVENAVWHYLCNAKVVGAERARGSLIKIGHDARVPLMTVLDLFAGKAAAADVLRDAEAGHPSPARRREQLFYAHLYLGLYYESTGDPAKSLAHMTKAATDYSNPHYMGDVARVHAQLRKAK